jgi:hypothetical protein
LLPQITIMRSRRRSSMALRCSVVRCRGELRTEN